MKGLWEAYLIPGSPHYREWLEILGTDEVPLISPADGEALLGNEPDRVHLVDISKLSAEQFARLVRYVSTNFQANPDEVAKEIKAVGFPIRTCDVVVAFSLRAFL